MAEAKTVPWAAIVACLTLVFGAGLTCFGVYILAGLGWSVLAAAALCFALSSVIFRGLLRGK